PQRVAELESDGHVRERVEIDEAKCAVRVVREQKIRDLRVAVHDSIAAGGNRWQRRSGFEHAGRERVDGVEEPVWTMLDECLTQRAEMPRRVMHAEAAIAKLMVEVADRTMKLRDDAAGRARLRRSVERIATHSVDTRQHAPNAFVLDPQRARARRNE